MALGFGFGMQWRILSYSAVVAQGKLKVEAGGFLLQEDGRFLLKE